jgi:hypothetical protein
VTVRIEFAGIATLKYRDEALAEGACPPPQTEGGAPPPTRLRPLRGVPRVSGVAVAHVPSVAMGTDDEVSEKVPPSRLRSSTASTYEAGDAPVLRSVTCVWGPWLVTWQVVAAQEESTPSEASQFPKPWLTQLGVSKKVVCVAAGMLTE